MRTLGEVLAPQAPTLPLLPASPSLVLPTSLKNRLEVRSKRQSPITLQD